MLVNALLTNENLLCSITFFFVDNFLFHAVDDKSNYMGQFTVHTAQKLNH